MSGDSQVEICSTVTAKGFLFLLTPEVCGEAADSLIPNVIKGGSKGWLPSVCHSPVFSVWFSSSWSWGCGCPARQGQGGVD